MNLRIANLERNRLLYIYSQRSMLKLDSDYQRISDVWTTDRRQLLIDSILNGFDIPKIYLHEFEAPRQFGNNTYKYEIVDGRQRLQSMWDFIDGKFPLRSDFEYFGDRSVQAALFDYRQLAARYPNLKVKFDNTPLPIMSIQTDADELIEELFLRLEDGAPLQLAGAGGQALATPAASAIVNLAKDKFFTNCLPFSNQRSRHFDIAAKFLLLADASGPSDLRKQYVDRFVAHLEGNDVGIARLAADVAGVLNFLRKTFARHDPLLKSSGMILLYFLLNQAVAEGHLGEVPRDVLLRFEEVRWLNKGVAEDDLSRADYDLLEFDRLTQNPYDKLSLEFRLDVLRRYILEVRSAI